MDRDTVIALAREANIGTYINLDSHLVGNHLERFAALVAAHEREECAKVCEREAVLYDEKSDYGNRGAGAYQTANHCAVAIRSRA